MNIALRRGKAETRRILVAVSVNILVGYNNTARSGADPAVVGMDKHA